MENYEQKYKDALDYIKKAYEFADTGTKADIERKFPELKESEDERIRREIISFIKEFEKDHYRCINFSSWIAYLERQKEQKTTEWSEEDEKFFKTALWHISYSVSNGKTSDCHCDTTDWLKGVKERLKFLRPQPKQKWSQDDNDFADDAIACVRRCHEKYIDNKEFYQSLHHNTMDIKRWLIKVRKRLTPHWKPSEEQMNSLECFIKLWGNSEGQMEYIKVFNDVKLLYQQLKKL